MDIFYPDLPWWRHQSMNVALFMLRSGVTPLILASVWPK